ncbi:MAG: hypothetical protein ACR650_09815 [Methylocystis sp.]
MNPFEMIGQNWSMDSFLSGVGKDGKPIGLSAKTLGLAGLQAASSYGGLLAQAGQTRAQGMAQAMDYSLQAQDEGVAAGQAFVEGAGQVAGLRQNLAQALGSRQAIAAASGVDVGQGVVADNRAAIGQSENTAENVTRLNSELIQRRHLLNQQLDQMRALGALQSADTTASAQKSGGLLSMALGLGKLFLAPATGGASAA